MRTIAIATMAIALMPIVARAQLSITAHDVTDEHVQRAIDAIVNELYARKHPDRLWEPEKIPAGDSTRQRGGYTALTVLALLHAGQSYQDPRLKDAIDYLSMTGMEGTYALALRASVWAKLPPKFAGKLEADAKWIIDGFSEKVGGWDYVQDSRTSRKDNSIRQFGALALWEAAKRGAAIEPRLWQRLEDACIQMQLADGGWNYTGDGPATGSMTAANLANLFITQDFLHASESLKIGGERSARHEQSIERGLKWLDEHFSPIENPGRNTYFYYYLYGVERVGLASGYKFFGGRDWYREGAAELIRRLCNWDEAQEGLTIHATTAGDGRASKIKVDDLAFALMFLSRGRVPVAINKLEAPSMSWNNRPRDAANLTRWIVSNSETELNWQIVSLSAEPQQWLDAPMLYLASHEPLSWLQDVAIEPEDYVKQVEDYMRHRAAGELAADAAPPTAPEVPELVKLKRYLDLGGLIFAVNEGDGAKRFAQSIEHAGMFMYPHYKWRTLPEDHWAYTIHSPVKSKRPALRGLSNGVRELIILASGDLAETFQGNVLKQSSHFETATNVYFYASEMNRPRPRLAWHERSTRSSPPASPQAPVTIVRAIHQGNWKPEPQALALFADWLAAQRGIAAKVVDHALDSIHQVEPPPALIMVSGVDELAFTSRQVDAIKAFLEAGGTILFETCGGRGGFAASAEQMATMAFAKPIESLLRSRIVSGEGLASAANLARIEYRPYALQVFGGAQSTARLRGMTIKEGGRPQLLFSREDLSYALLDQPCWGVSGYAPSSARELLANIVQHAMAH